MPKRAKRAGRAEAQLSWKAGSGPGTDLGDDLCTPGEIQLFATPK